MENHNFFPFVYEQEVKNPDNRISTFKNVRFIEKFGEINIDDTFEVVDINSKVKKLVCQINPEEVVIQHFSVVPQIIPENFVKFINDFAENQSMQNSMEIEIKKLLNRF